MYQHMILIGNVGKDAQMNYTPKATAATKFSLAVNRYYPKGDGQFEKETTWFEISIYGPQAERAAETIKSGDLVLVEGRLRPGANGNPNIWIGRDGQSRASYEVVASRVKRLPKGENGSANRFRNSNGGKGYGASEIETYETDEVVLEF